MRVVADAARAALASPRLAFPSPLHHGIAVQRRHGCCSMLAIGNTPAELNVDQLVLLALPVIVLPTVIFVVAAFGPVLAVRDDGRAFRLKLRLTLRSLVRLGLPTLDLRAVEHGDRLAYLVERLRRAIGGHHDRAPARAGARCNVLREGGSAHAGADGKRG